MKWCLLLFLIYSVNAGAQGREGLLKILLEKEQKLVDALAVGDKSIWEDVLQDSCLVTIEDGSFITKNKLVGDLNPLPPGYKGMIKIIEPKLQVYGNTAVITFIDDEYLELYGQKLHTQYRQTDTWLTINGKWEIVAMQLFEIPKNPPPVAIPVTILSKYAGTYELGNDKKCLVSLDSGILYSKKNTSDRVALFAETENVFFRQGDGRVRVLFIKESGAEKYKMIERRAGEDLVWNPVK